MSPVTRPPTPPTRALHRTRSGMRVGTALAKSDASHRAASVGVEAVAEAGQSFELKGGDGVVRTLVQAPGEVNGQKGIFEYIINKAGQVTHQIFIKDGVVTGLPNQKPLV